MSTAPATPATPAAKAASAAGDGLNAGATPIPAKQRLFAHPSRRAAYRRGGQQQILGGVSIGTEHQLDQILIGVHDTAGGGEVPGPDRPPVGGPDGHPRPARSDHRRTAGQRGQQGRPATALDVGNQHRCPGFGRVQIG